MLDQRKLPSLLLVLFLMVYSSRSFAQNTVGLLSIKPNQVSEGYNLIYPYSQSTVYLLDLCGEVVHKWIDFSGTRPGATAYLLPNGNLVRCSRDLDFSKDSIVAGGFGGYVDILSWDNKKLHSFYLNDSHFRLHHDVAPMPNGNVLMIAWERITAEQAIALGRDPNTLPNGELWPDKILEWDPGQDSIVWEWRCLDHMIQERDSLLPNFGVIADHPGKIDLNFDTQSGIPDWMHTNFIDYNPVLDQIMISVRNFNEIWILDHSTTTEEAKSDTGGRSGHGGEIIYRWGNPAAYQKAEERLHFLHYQHYAHWTEPEAQPGQDLFGQVAIFDNFTEMNKSTALILRTNFDTVTWTYPVVDEFFGPGQPERIVAHPENSILSFSGVGSSAQLLTNGNVLIFTNRWGYAYEVNQKDELVWEYRIPMRNGKVVSQGEVLFVSDNETFNMIRYPLDYPAFNSRDLFPSGYLEFNPDEEFCASQTSSSTSSYSPVKFRVWPNPASEVINLHMEDRLPEDVTLYNLQGQVIRRWHNPASKLQVDDLESGIYLLAINGQQFLKISVMH
ncbi:MAG: aryl-sulfate sulfotransferase [Saprospiraceae bacterium]|nr:aryl-sulfate sulfotransferase [Saprospiraceae bacterium]MCB9320901.1 aryl-sulfate sulfotransferase [Lewinellaceae bacterium]